MLRGRVGRFAVLARLTLLQILVITASVRSIAGVIRCNLSSVNHQLGIHPQAEARNYVAKSAEAFIGLANLELEETKQ